MGIIINYCNEQGVLWIPLLFLNPAQYSMSIVCFKIFWMPFSVKKSTLLTAPQKKEKKKKGQILNVYIYLPVYNNLSDETEWKK